MRVLCIGLDSRAAAADAPGHAVTWTREISRLVTEYVVLAEGRHGHLSGPVQLSANATAWLVPGNPASYPFAAAAFAQRLHAENPFNLCTTEDPIRAGLAGALFSRRTGVPLNVENHSLHINEPVWLRSRLHHRFYNRIGIWVARHAQSIRNYSPDQEPPLLRLGIPVDRLFCVPPPCPPLPNADRHVARQQLGIDPADEVIVTVGRLVPYKNIGTLIDALALLRTRRPARLLIMGDGPSQEVWQKQAASLGVGDAVTWHGDASTADVSAALAAADVFVAPAVHETGPRTVMEAFIAGCPVVATPSMGVVHFGLCENGVSGRVVQSRDAHAMAAALEAYLADPDGARAMASIGRERTLERCSLGRVAREVASVFRETVQRADIEVALKLNARPVARILRG